MTTTVLILLYMIFGAVIWRLRGGAFTAITGINEGTDPDRIASSILFALPLVFINYAAALSSMVAIFVGLLISGWGPFQAMINDTSLPVEKSWMNWLPTKLGFTPQTVSFDLIGMAEAGTVFVLPLAIALFFTIHSLVALLVFGMIVFMPLAYLIPRMTTLPTIPKFATGQEWGEVFVGAFLALLLSLIFLF